MSSINYPIKVGHKNSTFMGCFLWSNIKRSFKGQVVESYLIGRDRYQGVAKEFGIVRELIRECSRLYERWGRRFSILPIQSTARHLNWQY